MLSKNNLVNLINPIIYAVNIVIIIVVFIFINKNVYRTIVIQGNELRSEIGETSNDINLKEFNEIVDKINSRKSNLQSITVGEIF